MSSTAVPALHKTFYILNLITDSSQPLIAAHIAKEFELPRSSIHNILQSLLTKYVIQSPYPNWTWAKWCF